MKGLLELWQHENRVGVSAVTQDIADSAVPHWWLSFSWKVLSAVALRISHFSVRLMNRQPPFCRCWIEVICTDSPTLFKFTPGRWTYAMRRQGLFQPVCYRVDVNVRLSHRGWQVLGRQTGSGHLGDRWLPPPAFPHLQQFLGTIWHSLPQTWGEAGHTVHFTLTASEECHLYIVNKQWLVYKPTLNV